MTRPVLNVLKKHELAEQWHSAIGQVVVSFGTLERLMLHWAAEFDGNPKLLKKHHKNGMKEIAPELRRVLQRRRQRLPLPQLEKALEEIKQAEALTQVATTLPMAGWGLTMTRPMVESPSWLRKEDERPKLVTGVRDLAWLLGAGHRINAAVQRMERALTSLDTQWPRT